MLLRVDYIPIYYWDMVNLTVSKQIFNLCATFQESALSMTACTMVYWWNLYDSLLIVCQKCIKYVHLDIIRTLFGDMNKVHTICYLTELKTAFKYIFQFLQIVQGTCPFRSTCKQAWILDYLICKWIILTQNILFKKISGRKILYFLVPYVFRSTYSLVWSIMSLTRP